MTPGEIIVFLIIAAVIGAVGQAATGYTAGGCLVSIVLGFIGAFLGRWLAEKVELPEIFRIDVSGVHFSLLWPIIGAALFVALLSLVSGRRT
ncbi:MAG TPA: GlsB/YeaQ/YmgE family stress response membrane protein [Gemmatimonadota bacterium]|jgi:uncharacterized membrane protein YeaQ/YmgE (transglycosylase-associated protein family)